jgi:fructose-1-phosphate kinase PfkB-like protein
MVDKTITLTKLVKARISRAESASTVVGGKGINVSRQIRNFGLPTLATGFVGGETGLMIERLLHQEGIPFDFVRVAGLTS